MHCGLDRTTLLGRLQQDSSVCTTVTTTPFVKRILEIQILKYWHSSDSMLCVFSRWPLIIHILDIARRLSWDNSRKYRATPSCVMSVSDHLDHLARGSPVQPARKSTHLPGHTRTKWIQRQMIHSKSTGILLCRLGERGHRESDASSVDSEAP